MCVPHGGVRMDGWMCECVFRTNATLKIDLLNLPDFFFVVINDSLFTNH